MKILFVTSSLGYGGAERTISWLADYMVKKDDEVIVLCFGEPIAYQLNEKVKLINGNITSNATSLFERVLLIFRRFLLVKCTIKRERPDAVFLMIGTLARYVIHNKKRKYKLILSERANPLFYNRKRKRILSKAYRKCDGIVFQTHRVSELYPQISSNKKVVIPNAVGNEYAEGIVWKGLNSNRIAAVGRIIEQKDYYTLIDAFALFLVNHPAFTLEIYGDGPLKTEVERYIADRNLQDKVFIMGNREDALVYVSECACYVLSSYSEGMPNTLIEAMAIGMPCISTDCEFGPRELISDGKNGLLVSVGDSVGMAKAMTRMVDDKKLAIRCGEEAIKIRETNSVHKVGEMYREFVYRIVNGCNCK